MVKVWCSEMLDYVRRRDGADLRRRRLRRGLPGRALLARRAREPHLRGHQRDQPPAGPGPADPPRDEGRAAGLPEGAWRSWTRSRPGPPRRGRRRRLPGRGDARWWRGPRRSRSCAWAWRCRSSAQELERAAGGARPLRRHRHGDLRAGERGAARAEARGARRARTRPRCRRPRCAASRRTRWTASRSSARRLLAAVDEGDMLRTYLAALQRFTRREAVEHRRPAAARSRRRGREGGVPASVESARAGRQDVRTPPVVAGSSYNSLTGFGSGTYHR